MTSFKNIKTSPASITNQDNAGIVAAAKAYFMRQAPFGKRTATLVITWNLSVVRVTVIAHICVFIAINPRHKFVGYRLIFLPHKTRPEIGFFFLKASRPQIRRVNRDVRRREKLTRHLKYLSLLLSLVYITQFKSKSAKLYPRNR